MVHGAFPVLLLYPIEHAQAVDPTDLVMDPAEHAVHGAFPSDEK
jgi:hypothetical protein